MTVEYVGLVDFFAIASGDWSQDRMAAWLRNHLSAPTHDWVRPARQPQPTHAA